MGTICESIKALVFFYNWDRCKMKLYLSHPEVGLHIFGTVGVLGLGVPECPSFSDAEGHCLNSGQVSISINVEM